MTANTSNSVTAIVEEFTPALPLIEGAIIKFSCPPEHALIGPNVTTCMGSGEWEPDPREVQCKHTGWDINILYSWYVGGRGAWMEKMPHQYYEIFQYTFSIIFEFEMHDPSLFNQSIRQIL